MTAPDNKPTQPTQADAQLREAINNMWRVLVSELVEKWETNQGSFDFEPYTDEILSLFQTAQQQLLSEVIDSLKELPERGFGFPARDTVDFQKGIFAKHVASAEVVAILEAKLKQLRDGGEK